MKIAEELSSIREELSSLKKEFSGLKTVAQGEEEGEKDFFGEEDDEKIALTGDELNNILNTADFTEEAGDDVTNDLSEDLNIEEAEDISSDPFPEAAEDALDLGSFPEDLSLEEAPSQDKPDLEIASDLDLDVSLDNNNLDELNDESNEEESLEFISAEIDFTKLDSTEDVPALAEESPDPDLDLSEDLSAFPDNEDFNLEEETGESSSDTLDLATDLESLDLEVPDPGTDEGILPDFAEEETEELKEIREHGAEPINFAPGPEDTDYLEHDPLVNAPLADNDIDLEELSTEDQIDESSDGHIDLSEAVIDEPDLSSEIQDNPLEEPSLEDISIGLDLSDLESEEKPDSEDLEVADFESEEEESVSGEDLSLIPEAFIEEAEDSESPIEEIEEESLSEEQQGIKSGDVEIPTNLQQELKVILSYLDQLLESLPDEKIEEFARSDYYDTYKKLFKDLGLV